MQVIQIRRYEVMKGYQKETWLAEMVSILYAKPLTLCWESNHGRTRESVVCQIQPSELRTTPNLIETLLRPRSTSSTVFEHYMECVSIQSDLTVSVRDS